MMYEPPIHDYFYGRYQWDGTGWSFVGDDDGPVVFQPVSFLAAFGDPIAKCCRQDWVKKYHRFFAMRIHSEDVHTVATGADHKGHKVDALDDAFDMLRNGPLKQHVSFPALDIVAGISGALAISAGVRSIHEAILSIYSGGRS